MFATRHIVVFALLVFAFTLVLLVCSAGRFSYEPVMPVHPQTVEVSPGLPASVTNAVLHVSMYEPANASPTNYRSECFVSRSLKSPVGGRKIFDAESGERWDEQRLIAINADGFKMLLQNDGGYLDQVRKSTRRQMLSCFGMDTLWKQTQ